MDQVGLGLLVFCVLALTMVCSVMTKRARRRTCRWRWWCPSASSQPESQVVRLDFDIGAFGEDSLAGNFDTLRSLIWTMGVCTTEENYHTLEMCSAQMELSERIHTSTFWEVWHCEMEKCNEVWPMWFRGIPLEFTGRARMQGCSKVLTLCNEVRRHRRLLLTLLHSPLYGIALCLYLCIHNCVITLVHLHFCICICVFVFIHLCLCNKVRRHRRPLLALPHPRRQQLLAQALFSWRW